MLGFGWLTLKQADEALKKVLDELFRIASELVADSGTTVPDDDGRDAVVTHFEKGVPFDRATALGNLVNAGWALFNGPSGRAWDRDREYEDYLSDLILKSAELAEFTKLVGHA